MNLKADKILLLSGYSEGLHHESDILKKNGFEVFCATLTDESPVLLEVPDDIKLALITVSKTGYSVDTARHLINSLGIAVIFVIKSDEEKKIPELETLEHSGIIHADSGDMVLVSAVRIALRLKDFTDKYCLECVAFKESEATLETLVNNIPIEFWAMDRDLRYTMQNSTSINNYGDVRGERIEDLDLPDDVRRQWIEQDLRVLNGEVLYDEYTRAVDGKKRFYVNIVSPVYVENEVVSIVGISIDITERKVAENDLSIALEENRALFKELQHRTKNNMAILSSLVELEMGITTDPEVSGHLESLKNRIYLIGTLYNLLYYSEGVDMVRLDLYLTEIARNIAYVYKSRSRDIRLELEFEPLDINAKRGVSAGLIMNELLSNSYKYAFTDKNVGIVRASLSSDNGFIKMTVADNGKGFGNVSCNGRPGLGMLLVDLLAKQLKGSVSIDMDYGVSCSIIFPE